MWIITIREGTYQCLRCRCIHHSHVKIGEHCFLLTYSHYELSLGLLSIIHIWGKFPINLSLFRRLEREFFKFSLYFWQLDCQIKLDGTGKLLGRGLWVEKQNLYNIAIFDIGIREPDSCFSDQRYHFWNPGWEVVRVSKVVTERRLSVEKLIQYWYRSLRIRFVFLWPTLSPIESMDAGDALWDSEDH